MLTNLNQNIMYFYIFRIDRTKTGHILGPAEKRSKVGFPERQMSKVDSAVTRALVNIAMCLGSNTNRQVE